MAGGSNYCSIMKGGTRREQAVELRVAGLSRSQIADAMGLATGGGVLSKWLRGVPPPEWTARPNAKDDVRERAVSLRREGKSYREIRQALGVSKGSLSLWLRDVPLTDEQQRALSLRGPASATARAEAIRANAARRRSSTRAQARDQIGDVSESELFVAGVVAYWAEGAKNKPWRFGQGVVFVNSDPGLIRLFLRWLAVVGIEAERLQFRLHIHESADVGASLEYWADVVGVPTEVFRSTTLKTHNPKTVRRNVGEAYHGCLVVSVRRSADLNLRIEGWCEGLDVIAGGTLVRQSGVV